MTSWTSYFPLLIILNDINILLLLLLLFFFLKYLPQEPSHAPSKNTLFSRVTSKSVAPFLAFTVFFFPSVINVIFISFLFLYNIII